MTQPVWRKLVSELRVPEVQQQWALALEVITSSKLMKIEVVVDPARGLAATGTWTPKGFVSPCTADGDFNGTAQSPNAPVHPPLASPPPLATLAPAGVPVAPLPAAAPVASPTAAPATGTTLVPSAPRGALIARIGGSTADQGPDPSETAPARIVFAIGRKCVFTVPEKPTGSLFLGVNDDPSRMADVSGAILVDIYEAI
ncbi:hypothetical protein [Reyranella sp.]|uniref:hypothetical protein n=1 Tax=Reyranella sp. TaxID=1929291 RepID=UPI003D12A1E2